MNSDSQRPAADTTIRYSATGGRLRAPVITQLMTQALGDPSILSLAAGFTDTASLPRQGIAAAVDELTRQPDSPEYLQYGTNQGRARLRELVAAHTASLDGNQAATAAGTLIGNGSQQLLYLATRVLCDAGDIVLVERPCYFVYLEMLRGMGVVPVALAGDEEGGLDFPGIARQLGELRQQGRDDRVKALYLMSYFANPSGRSRTEAEKTELAATLRQAGFIIPVIEDAAYRDLWFDSSWPCPSVLSLRVWDGFPRAYFGTLTKPYASGLKVGYVHVTESGWLDRMSWLKGHQDFGTAHFNQAVLERVLKGGGLEQHLATVRPRYRAKMHCLNRALEEARLRETGWRWLAPQGGLCMWLRGPDGLDTAGGGPLWRAAMEEKVLYVPGGLCMCDDERSSCVRLSYGILDESDLSAAAQRFARAVARATEPAARLP